MKRAREEEHDGVTISVQQGPKPRQEDAAVHFVLRHEKHTLLDYIAVFDGHGSKRATNSSVSALESSLHWDLKSTLARLAPQFQKRLDEDVAYTWQEFEEEYGAEAKKVWAQASVTENDMTGLIEAALKLALDEKEHEIMVREGLNKEGSTACVCVLQRDTGEVTVANVGDSRAVLVNGDALEELHVLHRVMDNEGVVCVPLAEQSRIRAAGGNIVDGYVTFAEGEHSLAVYRSFGDQDFKQDSKNPIITAEPHVCSTRVGSSRHLVLGTDGLFDYLTDVEVVRIVNEGGDAEALATAAVANMEGKGDNCTAVVVPL